MNESFNLTAAEIAQANLLLEQGESFTVPSLSPLSVFKKSRTFRIKPPYARTLVYLSRELVNIDFDENALKAHGFAEMKRILAGNISKTGRIVAIMVLRNDWKIRLFLPLLGFYFQCRVTPAKLLELTSKILTTANIPDFTHSIGFLSIQKRITAPAPMETPENQGD